VTIQRDEPMDRLLALDNTAFNQKNNN